MLRYAFINLSVFLSFIACSSFFVLHKVNLHAAWTYCPTGPLSQSTVSLTYQNLSRPLHNRAFFLRFTHLSFEVMEYVVSSQSPPRWRAHGTVDIVTNHVWRHFFGYVDNEDSDGSISLKLWHHCDPEIQDGCHPVKDGRNPIEQKTSRLIEKWKCGFWELIQYVNK